MGIAPFGAKTRGPIFKNYVSFLKPVVPKQNRQTLSMGMTRRLRDSD